MASATLTARKFLLTILCVHKTMTAGNTELFWIAIVMLLLFIGGLCATGIFFWVLRKERNK